MRIRICFVGKPRDLHANTMAAEFIKRATRYCQCEMREVQPRRFDPWDKHPSATKIALDPAGRRIDTQEFIGLVERAELEARDLVFLIGGHDGLPEEWVQRAEQRISLSAMTFPHELARVMLAEQIYRAFTTLRGHPYPR